MIRIKCNLYWKNEKYTDIYKSQSELTRLKRIINIKF